MKKVVLFIICAFTLSSCFNNKRETKSVQQTTTIDANDATSAIHQLGIDSLKGDTLLLVKTIAENLIVVDNHLKFAITKDSFVNIGFSEHYYDRLMKDLKSANHMIDSTGVKDMDEILKKSYWDLYQKFGEPDRKP